jgi:hypothetical protein
VDAIGVENISEVIHCLLLILGLWSSVLRV